MEKTFYRRTPSGIILNIRVVPRSSKTEISGVSNNELKIKLTAPPVEGEANRMLIDTLHKHITKTQGKIKKTDIKILKGEGSKSKQVQINGLDEFII
ncbi:MAG: YggU family protein [Nitrospirae bacterium]|nr:YggU family protein [Nitrospirota bacterium]